MGTVSPRTTASREAFQGVLSAPGNDPSVEESSGGSVGLAGGLVDHAGAELGGESSARVCGEYFASEGFGKSIRPGPRGIEACRDLQKVTLRIHRWIDPGPVVAHDDLEYPCAPSLMPASAGREGDAPLSARVLERRVLDLDGPLDDGNGVLPATRLLTLSFEEPSADINLWIHSPGGVSSRDARDP